MSILSYGTRDPNLLQSELDKKTIAVRASEDDEEASFFANDVLLFGYAFISFLHSMSVR